MSSWMRLGSALAIVVIANAQPVFGQSAQADPPTSDQKPQIRLGTTIFADYTISREPKEIDADGNEFSPRSFNVGRAYLNLTGTLSDVVEFRLTPDIVRPGGSGASADDGYTVRLKYAYGQFNLDRWVGRGTFARLGMQPTPWIDFIDDVYRYRFQGPIMEDREDILSSADVGATVRYVFGGSYGDVHGGFYNGDGYESAEANDQNALMVRATIRPLPGHALLRGFRVTGFIDRDAYLKNAERRRGIAGLTFEHGYVNAGLNYVATTDRVSGSAPVLDGRGFSVWATPKTPASSGLEGLLRFDSVSREQPTAAHRGKRRRTIAGIAYWFRKQERGAAAVLLDVEHLDSDGFVPVQSDERRWAMRMLINF